MVELWGPSFRCQEILLLGSPGKWPRAWDVADFKQITSHRVYSSLWFSEHLREAMSPVTVHVDCLWWPVLSGLGDLGLRTSL